MSFQELDAELLDPATEPKLSLEQLFLKIWRRPKKVFTALSEYPELKTSIVLIVFSALLSGTERMQNFWYLAHQTITLQVLMPFISGTAISVCASIGLILLLQLTGRWMGGKASLSAQTSVYGFATLPLGLIVFLILPNFFVYKNMQESSYMQQQTNSSFAYTLFLIFRFIKIGLSAWTLVLHIIGVATVQKFSYLKAFLNFVFASALIIIPLLILGYLHIL